VLLVSEGNGNNYRFFCQSCPYIHNITETVSNKLTLKAKDVDDVLGADAWKNVDQTDAECAKCGAKRAYFMQIQTRSADEPMTTFYKCTNFDCQAQWKES
jgi:DNA-directed RNA polymerase III subunit RPC11